eukprot:5143453-Pyramimonas_sp.AAC.1
MLDFPQVFERFRHSRLVSFPTLQDRSKSPQDRPRMAQESPETTQEGPKTDQEASKTAEGGPRRLQRGAPTGDPNGRFEPSA